MFIVSLPRTGTTLLQRLLALDTSNRSPLLWELLEPAPAPDLKTHKTDPRIAKVRENLKKRDSVLQSIHGMGAEEPEECYFLHQNSFRTPSFSLHAHIPGYMEWLGRQDMIPTYEYQRLQLQILQFRYPTNRWVLKAPDHMYATDALLAVFPDACVVQTLRDPLESIPSYISLAYTERGKTGDHLEVRTLARGATAYFKYVTDRYLKARDAADPDRFYDIGYPSLVKEPVATVHRLYEHFGYEFRDDFEKRMREWLAENPQHKHGVHRYSLEEFGLDRDTVYSALGEYCRRFGLVDV